MSVTTVYVLGGSIKEVYCDQGNDNVDIHSTEVSLRFSIISEKWKSDYENLTNAAFRGLATELVAEVECLFFESPVSDYVDRVHLSSFSGGSLVVQFIVTVTNTSAAILRNMSSSFYSNTGNLTSLGRFKLDPHSVAFNDEATLWNRSTTSVSSSLSSTSFPFNNFNSSAVAGQPSRMEAHSYLIVAIVCSAMVVIVITSLVILVVCRRATEQPMKYHGTDTNNADWKDLASDVQMRDHGDVRLRMYSRTSEDISADISRFWET